jgi:low temperature requirement protein LtrA
MLERFSIFTIIVLGEAFVKVLDDAQGAALGIEQILFGVTALVVLYTLSWLYFVIFSAICRQIFSAICRTHAANKTGHC